MGPELRHRPSRAVRLHRGAPPHLADGTHVAFICSAVEDPERRPAVVAGFRVARYLSATDSAHGRWAPGGAARPGFDSYATAKQGNLATVLSFAREMPRLRFSAIEPGFNPGSGLSRDAHLAVRLFTRYVLSPVAPLVKYWSTPAYAARMIAQVLTSTSTDTGVYYERKVGRCSARRRCATRSSRTGWSPRPGHSSPPFPRTASRPVLAPTAMISPCPSRRRWDPIRP